MSKRQDEKTIGYTKTPHRSKKATKRWCKGKVGVEHKPRWEKDTRFIDSLVFACVQCGKHLDYWHNWPFWLNRYVSDKPPEIGSTTPLERKKK